MVWWNVLPPSSWSNSKPSQQTNKQTNKQASGKQSILLAAFFFPARFTH
jgi:hypothetical protein